MTDRIDQLNDRARWYLANFDEIDLAEICADQEANLATLRAVARDYCPACGRGDATPTADDWEQQKRRADAAEAAIERVRALRDSWLGMTLEPGQVRRLLDGITTALQPPAPAHNAGPTVREAAAQDNAHWNDKYAGEGA